MNKNKLYVCALKIGNRWKIKSIQQNPINLLGPEVVSRDLERDDAPVLWSTVQDYKILEILK